MRRLVAILLLLTLSLQSLWGAAEPYCQHEQGRASHHVGHHVHDIEVPAAEAQADQPSQRVSDLSKARAMVDHDHHCCSAWTLVPDVVTLPPAHGTSPIVASVFHALASADPGRIERPNWPVSR